MAESLHELMLENLADIYDAEKQASKLLPRMLRAASSPDVKKAFQDHIEQTTRQIQRLEEIFQKLEAPAKSKACLGMQGLVAETDEHMAQELPPEYMDTALVASEQKAEHYEIAAYTFAHELAEMSGEKHAARLLRQTLAEEERMSRKLAQISTRWLRKTVREEEKLHRQAA
jgi:ferritin-like metal-binding protein YciE